MKKVSVCLVTIAASLVLSAMEFVDLAKPNSIRLDGAADAGRVTLGADGIVRVSGDAPLSWIELEWHADFSCSAKALGGAFERTYGDVAWRAVAEPEENQPQKGAKAWYVLVTDGQRTDGYGIAVQPNVFAAWHITPNRLRLVLDCRAGSHPVRLGARTLEACRLVSRKGVKGESAFAAGRAFCRMMCPSPRLPKEPIYGYNDWYCAYGRNTAENFLADAAFIVSLVAGEPVRPFVVVDDGWQRGRQIAGAVPSAERWAGVNAKWGMEMNEFARRVKAMGAKPGLWYRPFYPDNDMEAEEGWKVDPPIDPTDPALEPRVRADIRRFVVWGIELIKIDFLTCDWCMVWGMGYRDTPVTRDLPHWRDESRTTVEVMKSLYTAMREAAGDMLIIGCNALDHLAAGLFEIQRTGDDTSGREWARTRDMGPNTLGMRAIHDRTFYCVDGDCMGLSEAGAVPWEKNAQWLDLIARSGTALFVSWKRELTTPESKAALEKALRRAARAQPTGEPLDWLETPHPARWRFGSDTAEYQW